MRAAAAFAILPFILSCLAPSPVQAQGATPVQRSYINPFPGGDRYRIVVLGDSLADGLWAGLYRAFEDDATLEFINRSKAPSGLSRTDNYDWNAELDKLFKDETYQIAVVMFGANDAQGIRKGKESFKVGTEGWREAYGKRVEDFIKKLRAKNIATYWVGLPVMRSPAQNTDAELMNEVFREKAFINGAKFVDTWTGFTDESGRYSAYGPDMSGQVKRLRADDGLHLTMRGYLKLAHFVEKDLRKDLNLAKVERNIPLAGNEEEQAKVMGSEVAPAEPAPPPQAEAAPVTKTAKAAAETTGVGEKPEEEGAEQAVEVAIAPPQSQVGEVSVIRPVISPSTLEAAQSLGSQGPNAPILESEIVRSELPGGLTAVATISAVTDLSLASSRPRLPLTQRPYYKVLIKGEQLKPKSGRADDFAWTGG
ncbi:MAG: SGNH family hydrolase [Methyloceanibacter sp.]